MINVVALAGNAVGDPTVRSTNSGKKVATFRLAVNNPLSEKEFVEKYVKKGSLISVVGRLKQDTWEKDGQKRSSISVITERLNFVNSGKKKDGGEASDEEAPAPRTAKPAAKTYAKAAPKPATDSDDDIPI